jgi:[acyl-carrier-protein] S-malonyltransferase
MWALMFPGQGSQTVGMGKFLFDEFSEFKKTIEEASDSVSLNFKKLIFEDPDNQLNLTEFTQPALLTVSVGMYRVLKEFFPVEKATISAGHSLGEYSALVTGGVLSFSTAVQLTQLRGRFMQEAVPQGKGGMVACLGVDEETVLKIVSWCNKEFSDGKIEPANFNCPGQIVLSGNQTSIDYLIKNYTTESTGTDKRAKFIPLKVSAPFHCSLMKPAQEKMGLLLNQEKFTPPSRELVCNVTAEETRDPNQIKTNLIQQISAPVKWMQSVSRMRALGYSSFIEVGPGNVLAGLLKKIDSTESRSFNIGSIEHLKLIEGAVR